MEVKFIVLVLLRACLLKIGPLNVETQLLVIDGPVEFKKQLDHVQDCQQCTDRFRRIYGIDLM